MSNNYSNGLSYAHMTYQLNSAQMSPHKSSEALIEIPSCYYSLMGMLPLMIVT